MKNTFTGKLIVSVLLIITVFQIPFAAIAGTDINATPDNPYRPEVNAVSAILTDSVRGQILYGKNIDERLHISVASKIMTAVVVLLHSNINDMVTVSKESAESEGSTLLLEPGEKYRLEDLVYAIVLRSYNDAAMALAEHTGGSVEKFVTMMNELAEELGLKDTHFVNPTGLYAEGQYTTARDLAVLIKYAISIPEFNRIFSSRTKIWTGDGNFEIMTNQNMLFWEYESVDGGKTGYNEEEKRTIVTTATKNGLRLIAILMDSPPEAYYEDTKALLNYGFNHFMRDVLVSKGEVFETIRVGENEVNLISASDIYYIHPRGDDYIKNINYTIQESIKLPVTKTQILGTARFELDDGTFIEISLYPDRELKEPESKMEFFKRTLMEHRDILYLLGALLAVEALILVSKIIKLAYKAFKLLIQKK